MTEPKIILAGPMGAGKSSVGRRLAARLSRVFVDADAAIEAHSGQTIPAIFDQVGEAGFRALELAVIERLLADPIPGVVALGGGAFLQPRVRELAARQRARTVYLHASPRTSLARVAHSDRPLLAGPSPLAVLERLYRQRDPIYALAQLRVATDDRSVDEVVEAIIEQL